MFFLVDQVQVGGTVKGTTSTTTNYPKRRAATTTPRRRQRVTDRSQGGGGARRRRRRCPFPCQVAFGVCLTGPSQALVLPPFAGRGRTRRDDVRDDDQAGRGDPRRRRPQVGGARRCPVRGGGRGAVRRAAAGRGSATATPVLATYAHTNLRPVGKSCARASDSANRRCRAGGVTVRDAWRPFHKCAALSLLFAFASGLPTTFGTTHFAGGGGGGGGVPDGEQAVHHRRA